MYKFNQNRPYSNRRPGGAYKSNKQYGGGGGFPNRRRIVSLPNDPTLFTRKASNQNIEEVVIKHKFEDFDLVQSLKTNISKKGYIAPTPIQDQAIPAILAGRDVIGLAATGTGKTAAFLIPLINKLYKFQDQNALIIAPTRELAVQINDEFKSFAFDMKLYSALVIGGSNINRQLQDIRRNPNLVIATPGRLKDLVERRIINLKDYSNIVLDEVDLMVDIGFINDIKYFISLMPEIRQSLFFSATIPFKVQGILQNFVKDPVTVSVKKQDTSDLVDQDVIKITDPAKKIDQLHDLLIQDGFDKVMIFGRTKHGVEKLHKALSLRGFKAGAIHGNKKQSQRQRVLQSFKRDEIQILLATDVASRGLDIDNVTHVINYELPETFDDYIHRIGRTGRAGKTGVALTFIT